jgi:hypothetical protein
VRIPYVPVSLHRPIPSLGGGLVRYRPVVAVRLTGPGNDWLQDCLLDTGADETIFYGVQLKRALAPLGTGRITEESCLRSARNNWTPYSRRQWPHTSAST